MREKHTCRTAGLAALHTRDTAAATATRTRVGRHSLHAISAQLSPVPGCLGIEVLQADTFDLHCFQARAGCTARRAPPVCAEADAFSRQLFRGKRLSASVRRLRRPQAPTGTKFFVTAAPRTIGGAALLRVIYELFTDYALKNPFYEVRRTAARACTGVSAAAVHTRHENAAARPAGGDACALRAFRREAGCGDQGRCDLTGAGRACTVRRAGRADVYTC